MVFAIDAAKALLVRCVLVVHSLLVIWLASSMTGYRMYWLLTVALLGMIVETVVTVGYNKAQEWKCLLVIWLASSMTGYRMYWLLTVALLGMIVETVVTVGYNKAQEWKCLLVIWLASSMTGYRMYWLLTVALLGMIVETVVTVGYNKAQEWKCLLVIWLASSMTGYRMYWLLTVALLGMIVETVVTVGYNKAQEWKCLLVIWLASSMTGYRMYWLLTVALLGMIVETVVTVGYNKAQEWKCLLVIWLASSMTGYRMYWLLTVALLGMIVETVVTVGYNKAQEWKWFCPCFFTYLCSTIPGIWVLELNRMRAFQETQRQINTTALQTASALSNIEGLHIPVEIETDTLVVIMEQLFLYLMILSRWFLPRGEITRDELSQLLFVFIGVASDITELFALFEEDEVRQSTNLTYAILCVWTFSLLQFTFVLTTTHNPQKASVINTEHELEELEDEEEKGPIDCIKHIFVTEIWSIFVNFLLQDGPFLAIRLYTMINMGVLTYSIIFFTAKNGLLVMLLTYRFTVLCCERKRAHSQVGSPTMSTANSKDSLRLVSTRTASPGRNSTLTRHGSLERSSSPSLRTSRSMKSFDQSTLNSMSAANSKDSLAASTTISLDPSNGSVNTSDTSLTRTFASSEPGAVTPDRRTASLGRRSPSLDPGAGSLDRRTASLDRRTASLERQAIDNLRIAKYNEMKSKEAMRNGASNGSLRSSKDNLTASMFDEITEI